MCLMCLSRICGDPHIRLGADLGIFCRLTIAGLMLRTAAQPGLVVAVLPLTGRISLKAARNRAISSALPTETLR
jgi:hypothetical protein